VTFESSADHFCSHQLIHCTVQLMLLMIIILIFFANDLYDLRCKWTVYKYIRISMCSNKIVVELTLLHDIL